MNALHTIYPIGAATVILSVFAIAFNSEPPKEAILPVAKAKKQLAFTKEKTSLNALIAFSDRQIEPACEEDVPYPEPPLLFIQEPVEAPPAVVETVAPIYDDICGCAPAPLDLIKITETEPYEEPDHESILPEPVYIDPYVFEAKAYPNPALDFSTIELNIERSAQFDVQLYDMSGQLIQQVHSGILDSGRQRFQIDLTSQMTGLYLVLVISGDQTETLKIQRI